jgi:hypothetical protein
MRLPGLLATMALSVAVFATSFLVSCTTLDPAPLYLDINYQVRCGDCQPRSIDDKPRDIKVINGEDSYVISCNVNQVGAKRQVSFTATHNGAKASDTYKFNVDRAFIDGKDPGNACKVRVSEGANTYVGSCTSGTPTADKPCQLSFKPVDGVITGSIWCQALPNGANSTITRDVVAPYTDVSMPTKAAVKFELDGCPGL